MPCIKSATIKSAIVNVANPRLGRYTKSGSILLVLFQLYAGAQAQLPPALPQSVDGRLDASLEGVVAALLGRPRLAVPAAWGSTR